MTLMFGNLTVAFVQFGTAAAQAFGSGASPAAFAALEQAASDFKATAAKDALYLVCIGTYSFISLTSPSHSLFFPRSRNVRHHLYLHGHLDSYRRDSRQAYP